MTDKEAEIIFKSWQEYMEIADKLEKFFYHLPESFLPYPANVLEEALNIMAKRCFDNGDTKMADTIQTTIGGFLWTHIKDEEAIESMKGDLDMMLENPELKEIKLKQLKERAIHWGKNRKIKAGNL